MSLTFTQRMGAHLNGRQQDGVADAVGKVVEAPQLMTHGMDVAQAGGVEGCPSQILRVAAGPVIGLGFRVYSVKGWEIVIVGCIPFVTLSIQLPKMLRLLSLVAP